VCTFNLSNSRKAYIHTINSTIMATIQNNTTHTFSPASQQAIRNAMANAGLDEVVTKTNNPHNDVDNILNFFDTEGNYQFSIDVENDVVFENQYAQGGI